MTDAHTTTIDAFEMRCALHHGIGQDGYGDFHRRGQHRNGQNARHRLNVSALKAKLARLQTWAPRPAVGFNLRWRGAFEHYHLEAQDNATPLPTAPTQLGGEETRLRFHQLAGDDHPGRVIGPQLRSASGSSFVDRTGSRSLSERPCTKKFRLN
jgi:hypothetical protein